MTLRFKTIAFTTLSIGSLMIVLIGALANVLNKGFIVVENDRTKTNAERVQQAFEVEVNNLDTKISDWSSWDDTYGYIVDRNSQYEESNLTDGTLTNLDIQLMVFLDAKGTVVKEKIHDLIKADNTQIPSDLTLAYGDVKGLFSPFLTGKSVKGFIMTSKGPFLVASRPILTSSGAGPARGVIIFARYYDDDQIKKLDRITRLKLEMYSLQKLLSHHGRKLYDSLLSGSQTESIVIDDKTIEGYILIRDIYGNPAFPVEVKMARDIFMQAQKTIKTAGLIGGVGSFMFLLVTLVGFTYFVLKPLNTLTHDVSTIGESADMSLRLKRVKTGDEIGKLSQSINSMLQSIEYSEHLLKEERIRSKMYIDIVGTMIVVLSPTGEVTLVNKKACEVLEGDEKNIIGKNWFETFIPLTHRESVKGAFQSMMRTEIDAPETEKQQNAICTLSGAQRLISWHNSVLRNTSGQPIASISSGEDITESHMAEAEREKRSKELEDMKFAMINILEDTKNLEEKVKIERDRATAIISSIGDGLFVVDTTYRITMVNNATCRMLSVDEDSLVGKDLPSVVKILSKDGEISKDERPLAITLRHGTSITKSLDDDYSIATDHVSFPISFSTTALFQNDVIVGALVTFHDVTRDKQIKDTIEKTVIERTHDLTKEQARFMASIRNLSLGFIMTDTGGSVVLINAIARQILATTKEQLTIDDLASSFDGVIDIRKESQLCRESRKSKQLPSVQYHSRWVRLFIAPIITQDATSEIIGQVYVLEDTTESKMVERSKDEFFSIASHELRTPLTAIRGNTSMIMDFYGDKIPDPDMKEMIEDIHASSIRLIDIVNDFLNVSRIEQGKIDFKKTEFDVKDLVSESVAEFEGSALEKQVVVRFEDSGSVAHVYADRDRTKQILLNLVGNALKFTEAGEVVVRLSSGDHTVKMSVTDNGRGISKENQALLFRKFQQAGSSLFTRDTTKGTGLGLYISRLLAEGMGGNIWLEKSEEGVGSEFCVSLPSVT